MADIMDYRPSLDCKEALLGWLSGKLVEEYGMSERTARTKLNDFFTGRVIEILVEQLEKERQSLENIMAMETPEAKDSLRMYEIFKRDVEIQTPQNNSVYIAGLASILTGTAIWNFDPDALTDETREQNEGRKN